LQCPPEVESRIFDNSRHVDLSDVSHLTTPTVVAVGYDEPGPNPSRLGRPLAEALPRGSLIKYQHIGHFGPFQDPWTIGRDIASHAANSTDTAV
jgi:hypothetical protein